MPDNIKVLHIDSAEIWGGGQSQIATLIRESRDIPIEHHLASPRDSKLWLKTRADIKGYIPLPRSAAISPWAMFRTRQYCIKNRIQIIHAHCGKSHTFAYWLKRLFLPSIKLVVHRRIPAKIRRNLISRAKFCDPTVDHFICVSDFIRGVLIMGGVDADRITTVRSSKKTSGCSPTDKSKAREILYGIKDLSPDGSFYVVAASRLVPDKGLPILIEAFRWLMRELPRCRLIIAGEGPLEKSLKISAKSMMESGHVVFLGFRKDVPELLLGADVFVIPSLSEGLGSTIIEAMMARTAVIGSLVEGIPELVRHHETGLTVAPGQSGELFEALIKLAEDEALRLQLADNALAWAEANCTPRTMVSKTFDVYARILELSSK
jgi:glycosyltransferase involved in cell wall biosynthesis